MKQILVISGKGGTGKTSVSAALADLAHREMKLVLADADVDAANLELLLDSQVLQREEFSGGRVARILSQECIACGRCMEVCRFDAVSEDNGTYQIDPAMCEGCLACVGQCPVDAITSDAHVNGEWLISQTPFGRLFHANLLPGEENSGKLVTVLLDAAHNNAIETQADLLLVDGPPGIGCPVTAACRDSDLALLVSEPTVSGLHDLERILQVCNHFHLPAHLIINKADLHEGKRKELNLWSQRMGMRVLGEIPYDESANQSLFDAKPWTQLGDHPLNHAMRAVWGNLKEMLV